MDPTTRVRIPTPDEIRHVRFVRGYTQAAMGRVVGVTQSAVSRWETGRRRPNAHAASALWREIKRARGQRAARECKAEIRARPFGPISTNCETYDRVCYVTRGHALRAFVERNRSITETWGLDAPATGGEFDAINERYERRGRRRVRTLGEAINVALPPRRPFCLDRIDLDALNDTAPGRQYGPFELPDIVAEHLAYQSYLRGQRQYEDDLREQDASGVPVPAAEAVPF